MVQQGHLQHTHSNRSALNMKKLFIAFLLSIMISGNAFAATVSKNFTATGAGGSLSVKVGDSFTYDVSGTFVGTVVLQRSVTGGASWETVTSKTSTASGNVTVESSGSSQVSYRFICSSYTSGTITTTITDEIMAPVQEFKNLNGETIAYTTEDGMVIKNLTVTETATGEFGTGTGSGGDAADITFDNATYPTVESALNGLLYDAPTITSFTNNKNSVENGSTVTSTQLDWTISGTITSQSINNSVGSLATGLRTTTHSSSYSTNRTYTLTISDGTTTTTKNTTITFLNSNYYGVSANTSLTSGQVNALSNALASSKTQTRTITATDQYIYIAYPSAYGAATFTVNGLLNNDWTLSTQSHTNASGATVSYNVYRTNNLLTGTYTIGVN